MATEIRVPATWANPSPRPPSANGSRSRRRHAVKADEPLVELETDKVTSRCRAGAGAPRNRRRPGEWRRRRAARRRSRKARRVCRRPARPESPEEGSRRPPEPAPPAGSRCALRPPAVAKMRRRPKPASPPPVAGTGRTAASPGRCSRRLDRWRPGAAAAHPARRAAPRRPTGRARSACDDAPAPDHRARRLKDAQNTAAMLTTFNEVDATADDGAAQPVQGRVREEARREARLHGLLREGLPAQALKEIPAVNAEIDGDDIIYKNYYHIGVAVGTDKGLVVPVVRDADKMGLRRTSKRHRRFGRARRATAS